MAWLKQSKWWLVTGALAPVCIYRFKILQGISAPILAVVKPSYPPILKPARDPVAISVTGPTRLESGHEVLFILRVTNILGESLIICKNPYYYGVVAGIGEDLLKATGDPAAIFSFDFTLLRPGGSIALCKELTVARTAKRNAHIPEWAFLAPYTFYKIDRDFDRELIKSAKKVDAQFLRKEARIHQPQELTSSLTKDQLD